MNTENSTPTFEQLLDWLEGHLSIEQARDIEAMVSAENEADIAWLRMFLETTRNMATAEPPKKLVDQLERQFTSFSRAGRPSLWQRLVAGMSFDSYKTAATGVRSAATSGDQRQFLYETKEATVAFTVQRREQGDLLDVMGQILPADESEVDLIRITLLRENEEFDSTITDDLGEFILPAVPRGQYDLVLHSIFYEITIPSIDLYT